MPKEQTFVHSIIPNVVRKVRKKIEMYLQDALSVVLIVDIWDSKQMADFMGVAAAIKFKGTSYL